MIAGPNRFGKHFSHKVSHKARRARPASCRVQLRWPVREGGDHRVLQQKARWTNLYGMPGGSSWALLLRHDDCYGTVRALDLSLQTASLCIVSRLVLCQA